jgi:hypothetical protein
MLFALILVAMEIFASGNMALFLFREVTRLADDSGGSADSYYSRHRRFRIWMDKAKEAVTATARVDQCPAVREKNY